MDAADALRSLTSLEDIEQLAVLESVVRSIDDPAMASQLMRPLFGLLERFPWTESHGLFWGILHALERVDGYESQLVESVRRSAGEFNLLMVNRILNSGTRVAGDVDLMELLGDVTRHSMSEQARRAAQEYLSLHRDAAD